MTNPERATIIVGAAVIIIIVVAVAVYTRTHIQTATHSTAASTTLATGSSTALPSATPSATPTPTPTPGSLLYPPLTNAAARATKVFFGTYVSPGHSPISPERFTGYHTGVDLETTPAEQNATVPVSAACNGPLKVKEWASGYGGVAVQACTLNGQPVTVIYGHLYVNSIKPAVGEQMTAGEQFAVLGQGYSQQTDGERKHLHFGIHKGTAINILGYVQNKSDLSGWIDPLPYLK